MYATWQNHKALLIWVLRADLVGLGKITFLKIQ